jgi:hypothetical protein
MVQSRAMKATTAICHVGSVEPGQSVLGIVQVVRSGDEVEGDVQADTRGSKSKFVWVDQKVLAL